MSQTDDGSAAYHSAISLLRSCLKVQGDRRHHRLLVALRDMADPSLGPLFDALAQRSHPELKIHGLLGLAEIDPARRVDLTRVVSLEDRVTQTELISIAMDQGLLSDGQIRQMLQSPGVDLGIKIVLATRLVGKGEFKDRDLLLEAAESDVLGRRSLAALLLLQLGEIAALEPLRMLDTSVDPNRDQIRKLLLNTAIKFNYDKVAPWAAGICTEPSLNRNEHMLALRAALRFGAPQAQQIWRASFDSATDAAHRTRLALLALSLSPHVEPSLFDPLFAVDDRLIQQVGATGRAIASKTRPAEAIAQLIAMQHAITQQWALRYAREFASDEEARQILLDLMVIKQASQRDIVRMVSLAAAATVALLDLDPDQARALLRSKLADPNTELVLVQAMLHGLVRARIPDPWRVVEGLEPFSHPKARILSLLLLAKHERPLNPQQKKALARLVRGGGGLSNHLRIQAAWAYLKQTNQVDRALTAVLREG